MNKFFKIASGFFFAAIAVVAVLLIASKLPIPGNYQFLIVKSGSMAPAIKTGAVVAIKPAASYVPGDVITFKTSAKKGSDPTTHRIVGQVEEGGSLSYLTKGDANNSTDPKSIPASDVIGKVLFDVPYVGYALAAAKTRAGFVVIILIPALIIAYDEIQTIIRELRRMRKKKRKGKTSFLTDRENRSDSFTRGQKNEIRRSENFGVRIKMEDVKRV